MVTHVVASSIGALGVFTTLPTLRADALFLTDLVHVIPPLLKQKNLMVRIRASWALANLCDAMTVVDCSESVIELLFDSAMQTCRDNEKCKGNGVRALGCLWKMGRRETAIVDVLIKCSSSGAMKTRWNSLHALAGVIDAMEYVYVLV
jgi:hypothetical protein